ncbi:MAG: 3-hydroxyacyl-CoA dehydrogenase NAD-binding domain-containing protein [Vicinamibacterales bacterium]|jgi:3-hydroxyacyl-CoA dehydrogenase|nr:3-hydroxyacyl-CoA dehydrogenase NAD-binding domain-containing protein [Vicinamibacterales bacterium]HJN43976.1 3-hydroxyacyl-CoA dehydrogenase NAD-binding domain-containing protein [Vicinamibacterales bacterium]
MSDPVTVSNHDGVAVITLVNPPVNGLGFAVRTGLQAAFETAANDDAIRALVITGSGRMFSGGADIREFGQPPPPGTPYLPGLLDEIEALEKPVVAAIHGVALGGGCELALGCHVRLAAPGTRVGLPEVTLGILPGAGGTQRMPRLIGVPAALDLIVSGKMVPAAKAKALGILDEIVEGNVVEAAVALARRMVDERLPIRRASALDDRIAEVRGTPEIFADFKKKMARRARGFEAPYACVDCIEAAVALPFAEGLAKERETFLQLVASDQSKAQRHAFFAEREVAKIPDVPKDTPTRPVTTAAVIGCGTMGGGIAMNFANAGIPVTVFEVSEETLDKGLGIVRKNYAATVSKGRLSQEQMDTRLGLISSTVDYADLADADVVIEAVFEDMALKKEIFGKLDAACKPEAILASNTSTLDVNEIAAATNRPGQVIGTHFFSPANVMRLMENVRGAATSPETIATIMKLSKTIGKVGVLVGVCDGFVGNRMLYAYRRQADFLLEEGALPHQIDTVIYDFGMPMGPYAMGDLAGLDVGWRIRQGQAATRPKHLRHSTVADRVCELGRFGQKTGAGWHRYAPGSRTPIPDPVVEELILSISKEGGFTRRTITDQEILERCMYPLVNEGAKILEEGLALRASDIDIIWIYGYGFPRYRGGPMFWADLVGVKTIYDVMSRLHDEHGDWLEPAPLLKRLAEQGKGFADL